MTYMIVSFEALSNIVLAIVFPNLFYIYMCIVIFPQLLNTKICVLWPVVCSMKVFRGPAALANLIL